MHSADVATGNLSTQSSCTTGNTPPPITGGGPYADFVRMLFAATARVLVSVRHAHLHELSFFEPERNGNRADRVISPTI